MKERRIHRVRQNTTEERENARAQEREKRGRPVPRIPRASRVLAFSFYPLITHTLISGITSACRRMPTLYTPRALIGSGRSIWRFST